MSSVPKGTLSLKYVYFKKSLPMYSIIQNSQVSKKLLYKLSFKNIMPSCKQAFKLQALFQLKMQAILKEIKT